MTRVSDLTITTLTQEAHDLEWTLEAMRAIVVQAFEMLGEAKRREASLQAQLTACREELRVARQQVQERG